jgi:hypothetical protein
LNQLDERAKGAARVHEGHGRAARSSSRRLVDQLSAGGSHLLQCRGTIGYPVADVVDALAFALEEPRDWGAVGDRAEKLDERLGDFQQCLLNSVVLDPLAMSDLGTER